MVRTVVFGTLLSTMAAAALFVFAIFLIIFYVYNKITTAHSYWEKKGVKGPKPHPLFGIITWTTISNLPTHYASIIYDNYPNEKVVGLYQGLIPTLLVRDPQIIKTILVKDFSFFANRGFRMSKKQRHLFAVEGDEWKILRQKLSPIFTTGKLKAMAPLLNDCAEKYVEYLDKLIDGITSRDVQKLNLKFTLKCVASLAFGVDVNTYGEKPSELEKKTPFIFHVGWRRRLGMILENLCQGIVDIVGLTVLSGARIDLAKSVKHVIQEREGKSKVRKDFIDTFVELKKQGTVRLKDDKAFELEITDELIAALVIALHAAGAQVPVDVMSCLLYELAINPEIQNRCQEEIDAVMKKYNGRLDYDAHKEFPYVSMAIEECMRLHPVMGTLLREAVADYTFKDINLTIKKGTKIWMPVHSLLNDPKYCPNPEQFDPDRFSPENKGKIQDRFSAFGDGPRHCIALRYARLKMVLGIAHFLHKFRVSPCAKTPKKIKLNGADVSLSSLGGMWLNIEKRRY